MWNVHAQSSILLCINCLYTSAEDGVLITKVMQECDRLKATSVVFPALGTGNLGRGCGGRGYGQYHLQLPQTEP